MQRTLITGLIYLAGAACLGSLAGCSSDGAICTTDFRPGIVVEVRDAGNGVPVADGASGYVSDGAFVDSLTPYAILGGELTSFQAAHERTGTYSIHVERAGYAPWDTTGVRVDEDECHVKTVTVTAILSQS